MDLDKENTCITVSMSLVLSHYCVFSLPWFLFAIFWQWGLRPLVLPFRCLMPKGEKLRLKQLDQLPLLIKTSLKRNFDLPKQNVLTWR
jgi:hypothetical protein